MSAQVTWRFNFLSPREKDTFFSIILFISIEFIAPGLRILFLPVTSTTVDSTPTLDRLH